MQSGDVTVLGKENVAPLAAEVDAALWNGEGVARLLATDDEGDSPDITLAGSAEPLHAVRRDRLRVEWLELDDLLPDAKDVIRTDLDGDLARQLLVDAVE